MRTFKINFSITCFTILLALKNSDSYSQQETDFEKDISLHHLEYSAPSGFTYLESRVNVSLSPKYRGRTTLLNSQINADKTLLIAFQIRSFYKGDDTVGRKEKQFLYDIFNNADMLKNKISFLEPKQAQKLNADNAAEFDFLLDTIRGYAGFKKCKVRTIYRHDVGVDSVYYFYSNEIEDKVKELMKETAVVLKFKQCKFSPPLFGPAFD